MLTLDEASQEGCLADFVVADHTDPDLGIPVCRLTTWLHLDKRPVGDAAEQTGSVVRPWSHAGRLADELLCVRSGCDDWLAVVVVACAHEVT